MDVVPTGSYDEFLGPEGVARPHQQRLAQFLEGLARPELERLRASILHRINEQEVTFNILGVW